MIFVGGQRSLDGDGNVLGIGDIEVQTDEAFRNLDTMLRRAAATAQPDAAEHLFPLLRRGPRGHRVTGRR